MLPPKPCYPKIVNFELIFVEACKGLNSSGQQALSNHKQVQTSLLHIEPRPIFYLGEAWRWKPHTRSLHLHRGWTD